MGSYPKGMWEEIKYQYEMGISPAQLIRDYGLPRSTLYGKIEKAGWKSPAEVAKEAIKADKNPEIAAANMVKKTDKLERAMAIAQENTALSNPDDIRRQKINENHLRIARKLERGIEAMLALPDLGIEDGSKKFSKSRAYVDLTTCLEKIQKIDRLAMQMDTHRGKMSAVIILAPVKLKDDDWQKHAGVVVDAEVVEEEEEGDE